MRVKNLIVLGCGPAGLMALEGALMYAARKREQVNVMVVSRKQKSALHGAQYLHQPIPNHTDMSRRVDVEYQLRGSVEDYRRKVYGQLWSGTVSPEDLTESHSAWDIRQTYESLWTMHQHLIIDMDVDPVMLDALITTHKPDLIINSIPRPALCRAGHAFGSTTITAAGDAPSLGIKLPFNTPAPNMVVCNGEEYPSWYRLSNVFGHVTVEWPPNIESVPVRTAAKVLKPTSHDCDCWNDQRMVHVGRYGKWAKGVLSHTAYTDAADALKSLEGVEAI